MIRFSQDDRSYNEKTSLCVCVVFFYCRLYIKANLIYRMNAALMTDLKLMISMNPCRGTVAQSSCVIH